MQKLTSTEIETISKVNTEDTIQTETCLTIQEATALIDSKVSTEDTIQTETYLTIQEATALIDSKVNTEDTIQTETYLTIQEATALIDNYLSTVEVSIYIISGLSSLFVFLSIVLGYNWFKHIKQQVDEAIREYVRSDDFQKLSTTAIATNNRLSAETSESSSDNSENEAQHL